VDGVKDVFERYLSWNEELEFFTKWADPEVGYMPLSLEETILGAKNRVKNLKKIVEAKYYVAVEWGVMLIEEKVFLFGVTVIENVFGVEHIGISAMIELPKYLKAELYEKGRELGDVIDGLMGLEDNKSKNGAVGLFTNDAVTRTSGLSQATLMALMPFVNEFYR